MFKSKSINGFFFFISFIVLSSVGHTANQNNHLVFSSSTSLESQNSSEFLSVLAVGDVLLHKPLHVQALHNSLGHRSLWKNVLNQIESADMAYANLEGPVAPGVNRSGSPARDPGNVFDNHVYTSYPLFNYHESLVSDLVDSGFDIVSTANNHALDRGRLGVNSTIEILNKYNLPYTGTRTHSETQSSQFNWYTIVEKKGFRIAWLACSFSTNGMPDRYNQVLNCFSDRQEILRLIQNLSSDRSIDAIIVTPHVGVEYEDFPRKETVNLYRSFADAGALAIFGSHPHVLQPWEKYTDRSGRECFIIYSLGNFVSGQFHKVKTRATLMLTMNLQRLNHGSTIIQSVSYLPLEMKSSLGVYSVTPITVQSGSKEIYSHITHMFGLGNLAPINN